MKQPYTTIRQILFASAALLKHRGWCRRALVDNRGRHCLSGAIRSVTFDPDLRVGAYEAMKFHGYDMSWNDERAHSGRQVIAAFRRVARVS